MKSNESNLLLDRYLAARSQHKDIYLDATEVCELLESTEVLKDKTLYEEILNLGLRLHPQDTEILCFLGYYHFENCRFDEAIKLILQIIDTDNSELNLLLLECYCMNYDYKELTKRIDFLASEKVDYMEEVFETVIPVLNDQEQSKLTRTLLNKALALYPSNIVLKEELCFLYELEDNIPQAIKTCNELVDINPYSSHYWNMLGQLYTINKQCDKAIEAFDFAATCIGPKESRVEYELMMAHCLKTNGSYEKAIEVYNGLLANPEELTPDVMKEVISYTADCYIKIDNLPMAYKIMHNCKEEGMVFPKAYMHVQYVMLCMANHNTDEANEAMKTAIALFPNDPTLNMLNAKMQAGASEEDIYQGILLAYGSNVLSIKSGEELLSDSFSLKTGNLLTTCINFSLKGDKENALKSMKKLEEADPTDPCINMYKALVYLMLKDEEKYTYYRNLSSPELENLFFNRMKIFAIRHLQLDNFIKSNITYKLADEFLQHKGNKN